MSGGVGSGGQRTRPGRSGGDGRWLARVAFSVAGIAAALLMVSVLFAGRQEGYVHLRWMGHPGWWGLLCAAGLFVGLLAMVFGRFVGLVGTILSLAAVAAAFFVSSVFGPGDIGDQTIASPDGRRVLFIDGQTKMIDPYWVLWVQDARGLTAKYRCLGALDGDLHSLDSVRWVTDDEVELRIDGEPVRMTLSGDAASRPRRLAGC